MKKETSALKINRILNGFLLLLFLISIRIFYLAIYEHKEKVKASEKPQKRVSLIKANRAPIYDRNGAALAINKIQYKASFCYGEIREIPRVSFRLDENGKKVKYNARKEYITNLSRMIGQKLGLDPERIEDLIYAKSATMGTIPLTLKENITEEEYFQLKMLEGRFPGLHADHRAERVYPQGSLAGEVIGYLGPISKGEYEAVVAEMRYLENFLAKWDQEEGVILPEGYHSYEEVKERLKEIQEKAYTVNDLVGKAGIEKSFEEALRGFSGKKTYLADIRGTFLRELVEPSDSFEPRAGNRVYLSISQELQEYAEKLLGEHENTPCVGAIFPEDGVWIKGGAIIAMDPNTGEILALASYPRFDPNDFIRSKEDQKNVKKNERVGRWLELDNRIGAIWDGKESLVRERFDVHKGAFFEEEKEMDWESYLAAVFKKDVPVRKRIEKIKTIKEAIFVQNKVDELLFLFADPQIVIAAPKIFDFVYPAAAVSQLTLQEKALLQKKGEENRERIEKVKRDLAPYFQTLENFDKILFVDLCRLLVDPGLFSPELIEKVGEEKPDSYRALSLKINPIREALKGTLKGVFHEAHFKKWKEECFKEYLALKRKEEKKQKRKYARPYIEYLDEAEVLLFTPFYKRYRADFMLFFLTGNITPLLDIADLKPYIEALSHLRREVAQGVHKDKLWAKCFLQVKKETNDIEPAFVLPYLNTMRSFDELNRPLLGKYNSLRDYNGRQFERHLAAAFYPKYGYGFLRSYAFRQATALGSIFKLVPAYEALKEAFEEGEPTLNPLTIIDDKRQTADGQWLVGSTIDKRPIPIIYKGGRVPRSDHAGVGVVDLARAIEASSNPYFALLAGDVIRDPEDLCQAARSFSFGCKTGIDLPGEVSGAVPSDVIYNRSGLYAMAIGQHTLAVTPLQTAVMLSAIANGGKILKPKIVYGEMIKDTFHLEPIAIKQQLFLPPSIRNTLLHAMKKVIHGESGTARGLKNEFPASLLATIVGKTSTPEIIEKLTLDKAGVNKCKHVWFGAIYFDPTEPEFKKPELVVIIYLKYGEYGNKAAPYAIRLIQKHLELKKRKEEEH